MANTITDLENSIERGLAYLQQHQYPSGEFCCYMAPDDAMQEWCAPDSTVFPTALISHSLLSLSSKPGVDSMLTRSVQFLEHQRHRGGVWYYFTRGHRGYSLIPADVDDTVCVSSILKARNKHHSVTNLHLLLSNRNARGLFYTWFTLRPRWNSNRAYWRITLSEAIQPLKNLFFWKHPLCSRTDVDGVVNANALYYLGESEVTQPIIEYLLGIIAKNKEHDCDKWYRNPFSFYYFLSRNYHAGITRLEPARKPVIDRILKNTRQDGQIGNSILDTALAVCTLINWKSAPPELENAIHFLLNSQGVYGEWQRWILYYNGPKKETGWGSEELTTAFCLEALARFQQQEKIMEQQACTTDKQIV